MTISTPGNAVDGTIAAVVFPAVKVALGGTGELHIFINKCGKSDLNLSVMCTSKSKKIRI
jgi:hypothetical protein